MQRNMLTDTAVMVSYAFKPPLQTHLSKPSDWQSLKGRWEFSVLSWIWGKTLIRYHHILAFPHLYDVLQCRCTA